MNFRGVAEGPEYMRSPWYVAFAPLSADPLAGIFVYMCACDMENVKRNKDESDEGQARMSFPVYKTNSQSNPSMAEAFKDYFCDWCGQVVTVSRLVYYCGECEECFCGDCTKLIPQKPKKRFEMIRDYAEETGRKHHWIWNVKETDMMTFDKLRATSKRLPNVTFSSCSRDGLTPGCYPYEYKLNCKPIDDSWPDWQDKPWRDYNPENEHRQLTRHQKAGTVRRWSANK